MDKLTIKTDNEIEIMAAGGKSLGKIRDRAVQMIKPGMTTGQLDKEVEKLILEAGGKPSFKMVPGYHWATCVNLNEVVVHGIPGNEVIKPGDKVGIDMGMYFQGFHTDTATTIITNNKSQMTNHKLFTFLETGRKALKKAIAQAKPGKRVADISRAMQEQIEEAGLSVVTALTGHGIGKNLHELPPIPCFQLGKYKDSLLLEPGMVLAIEVMYNQGNADVVYKNDDGWTIVTADGKISGLFEHTVAIRESGPVILT